MHAFTLAALIVSGCVNCPPNGIIQTNTVIQTVGTNVLASAVISNGVLVVNAAVPSNQVSAVSSAIGTNVTPSQLIINTQ